MLSEQMEEETPVKKSKPGKKPTRGTEYKEKVKEFKTRIKQGTSLYEVHLEDGGVIPKVLKGLYTSPAVAEVAIGLYKANRRQYY